MLIGTWKEREKGFLMCLIIMRQSLMFLEESLKDCIQELEDGTKCFTKDPRINVDKPPVSNFKKAIERLENELVELLIKDGRVDLDWYLFHKEISCN